MEQSNPAFRIPVSYIDKSRVYYAAHEYPEPYRWANNEDSPFVRPQKPLSECRVGIITTTSLLGNGETTETPSNRRAPKTTYASPVSPEPEAMYTLDLSWDKDATHTRDVESFLPLQTLQSFTFEGRIGGVSPRFYGVPTEYSQRRTTDADAPEILAMCREDAVDLALLIPL